MKLSLHASRYTLHASRSCPLHLSRTLYKSALFMQNKPNLLNALMNATSFYTVNYENKSNWTLGENKPNSNPIKPNFRKAQMNVNSLITKDYRKKYDFTVQKKQTQFKANFRKAKMNITAFMTKDYENEPLRRRGENKPKTNPNKARLFGLSSDFVHKQDDFVVFFR